jgi:3-oxoacyl-[acyl-carrier protein] reductase
VRAALITGASRGVGRAVAHRLAGDGFGLTLTARDAPAIDALAQEIESLHGTRPAWVAADLSDPEAAHLIVEGHCRVYGRMDALVLNAGAGAVEPLESTTRDQLELLFGLNACSSLAILTAAIPSMREAVAASPEIGAKVIAVSSITGVYPQRKMAAYAASKAALRSLVESINIEHSAEGITSTAICPGYVATEMTEWLYDRIPPGEMLNVNDIAELASFLVNLSRRMVINEVVISRAGTGGRTP